MQTRDLNEERESYGKRGKKTQKRLMSHSELLNPPKQKKKKNQHLDCLIRWREKRRGI